MTQLKAVLALEDGSTFSGLSFGAPGHGVGEVVFNTAMSGYQEILTDPSYAGQLVTLTVSHVGNVGVNAEDGESDRPHAAGLIVRDCPRRYSSWRAEQSLPDYLREHGIVAIGDVDTRALTAHLREHGAMNGCILAAEAPDRDEALRRARECAPMTGRDLAAGVSATRIYEWTRGTLDLDTAEPRRTEPERHVVCYDYGVKHNILRLLVDAGCRVTVVPARTSVEEVMALAPDGVMLSNGPGDPGPCTYAVEAIRVLLDRSVPTFGICLGQQLLALAAGGRTIKMKHGHHGANHPVKDRRSGRVLITSQNHGFTVDEASLPAGVEVTHHSLFDGSLQGFRFTDRPALGFQGHPEAGPGPHDLRSLFDEFVDLMHAASNPGGAAADRG